jgi:hypothetical protein
MLEGLVIVAASSVFALLAARFGKSSRDSEDWFRHAGPVAVNE